MGHFNFWHVSTTEYKPQAGRRIGLRAEGNSYLEDSWAYKNCDFAKIVMLRHVKIVSWFQVWAKDRSQGRQHRVDKMESKYVTKMASTGTTVCA